jgi:hypothetical protein
MPPDLFEPDNLRLKTAHLPDTRKAIAAATTRKLPRPQPEEEYLGGPIPVSWLEQVAHLPRPVLWVGVALWFVGLRARSKNATVAITAKTLRRFRLTRQAVCRGLSALESAGLVNVERQTGRRSLVTILPAPAPKEPG